MIMKTKMTNKQFNESECASCIWLRKVDAGHYLCPFVNCMKEVDREYEKQIKDEQQRRLLHVG